MEYLVFMPHNPGDVVMALQAVTALRSLEPDSQIDFLTGEECLDLVAGFPGVRKAISLPRKILSSLLQNQGLDAALEGLTDFVADLESHQYTASLNLFQGKFGGLLQKFIQADKKSGLEFRDDSRFQIHSRVMEHLFAVPTNRSRNPFHAADLYRLAAAEILEKALPHFPPVESPWRLPTNPLPLKPQTYFVFHPGSAHRGKRWPIERWRSLIQLCLAEDHTVVLTGSKEEKALTRSLVEGMGLKDERGLIDLTGKTSWLQSAAVFRDASHLVCGDTVAMHLGAAVQSRVIALFGPSNPVETGPYGPGHWVLQATPVYGSELQFQEENLELARLDAETVFALLQGKENRVPMNLLWKTVWDECGFFALENGKGEAHPFQSETKKWLDILGGKIRPTSENSHPLLQALEGAIASPNLEAIRTLERQEQAWSEKTQNDLVWEAYRIALNGLPLRPLEKHLLERRNRLVKALAESYVAK